MTLIKSSFPSFPSFTDLFDDDWIKSKFKDGRNWPAINVIDHEKQYEVELAVPGFKKEDFEIGIENGVLTVAGKTEKEDEEKKKNYTRKEFSSRSFRNSFTLPENADPNHIEAVYNNGVLQLFIRKTEKGNSEKKKISVS